MDRELVILSSSPMTHEHHAFATAGVARPNGCDAPSADISDPMDQSRGLDTFATLRKSIPSGSRASAIPADAVRGFQAASYLPRKVGQSPDTTGEPIVRLDASTKKSQRTSKAGEDKLEPKKSAENLGFKTTKSLAAHTSTEGRSDDGLNGTKKRGRPRKTAVTSAAHDTHAQYTTSTDAVTIPNQDSETKAAPSARHEAIDLSRDESSPIVRKRAWTPPLDVTNGHIPSDGNMAMPALDLAGFNYGGTDVGKEKDTVSKSIALPVISVPAKAQRAKASPKKRVQTITDHALAKFYDGDISAEQTLQSNVEAGMTPMETAGKTSDVHTEQPKKKPRRTKTASKPKNGKQRPSLSEKIVQKLISPRSLARNLATQGMLFGTSSQLAVPVSPESLRRLRRAMLESQQLTVAPTIEQPRSRFRFANVSADAKSGIWDAGYSSSAQQFWQAEEDKELQYALLNTESIESRPVDRPQLVAASHTPDIDDENDTTADFQDIDDIPLAELRPSRIKASADKADIAAIGPSELQTIASTEAHRETILENASPQKQAAMEESAPVTIPPKAAPPIQAGAAAAAFKTALSAADKKRPKGRPRKLPAEPTKRRRKPASSSAKPSKANSTGPTTAKSPAKTTKGTPQPKTTTSDGFTPIDDILDDEPEITPSPPRLHTSLTSELPLTTTTTTSTTTTTAAAAPLPRSKRTGSRDDWDTIKPALFRHISRAVLACPPTRDPRQPSWYERMLLYQPVVLEDFAGWLGEQGVTVRGVDASGSADEQAVAPWMVSKWCDENSVCCLWKLTHRNEARSAR